jgi:amino acid/amide ABC transporter ATP-binding protein 1, HAAT family (TC 3.A.1.4.-)
VSSETLLQLQGVNKRFGGHVVLNDVSFSLAPGEIVGLVGPNGSGKTTTINVISGLYRADSGSIAFDGKPVHKVPMHKWRSSASTARFRCPRLFAI